MKNPRNIYIRLDVDKTFEGQVCDVPKRIFVKDCRSTDPLGQEGGTPENQIERVDLGSHLLELDIKEEAWKATCSSTWECTDWEECRGGIQRRTCEDLSNCFIPTEVPETVRYCTETCLEKWSCTWSDCVGGLTTPSCFDENKCGTEFNKPSPISCDFEERCVPEIECSSWAECKTDYSLINAKSQEIKELPGKTDRICIDKNSCVGAIREVKSCSTGVDIYTQKFSKCGSSYVDVHNKLDGSLVARLEVGTEESPRLNIRLDAGGEIYCDYCYNGVLDGDEEEIDCGGSCSSCAGKDGPISLGSQTFFGKIISWFKGIF